MSDPAQREILDWERFGVAGRELAQNVADDGYRPDCVIAIARGGLLVAGAVSYALDVKTIHTINVSFYTGIDERLAAPAFLEPVPDPATLTGARVLVADDVADTGGTLEAVRDFYAPYVAELRFAVVYEKPQSTVKCEYVWHRTDRWIDFPWSAQPTVVAADRALAAD